jgi:outer membrane lipoprotein-sorting protein
MSLRSFGPKSRRLLTGLGSITLLACVLPLLMGAVPLDSRAHHIGRIEDYLNQLRSLKARFEQVAPDLRRATGTLYYQRPDKMRLDYDPPSNILIISDGWWLIYYDRKLEQVSHLSIDSSPLGFLLSDDIRLSGDVTVTDVVRENGEMKVTLVQTDEPNEGSIQLMFTENPLELRRWTLVDAQGQATQVVLDTPETGLSLDRELFRFRNPELSPDARN